MVKIKHVFFGVEHIAELYLLNEVRGKNEQMMHAKPS